jgi:uncharacterized protein involved in exopolysaccharide biosynthesis
VADDADKKPANDVTVKADTKPDKAKTAKPGPNVGMWIGAGVGAGIGSAALAAALLYATRNRKKRSQAKD